MTVGELVALLQKHDPARHVAIEEAGRAVVVDVELEELTIDDGAAILPCVMLLVDE